MSKKGKKGKVKGRVFGKTSYQTNRVSWLELLTTRTNTLKVSHKAASTKDSNVLFRAKKFPDPRTNRG